jgi:hypothetical protein
MIDDQAQHRGPPTVPTPQELALQDDGPFCWECELGFDFNTAPPDCPFYACPMCSQRFVTLAPMRNFLFKRKLQQERQERKRR